MACGFFSWPQGLRTVIVRSVARQQISIINLSVLILIEALLSSFFSFAQTTESLSLDRPTLNIAHESNRVLKVSFQSVAVQKYQLAFSNDLRRWDVLGDLFDGTGDLMTLRVQKPEESLGFFRLNSAAGQRTASDQEKMIGVWRGGFPNEVTPTYELVVTSEKISGKNLKDGTSLGEGTYKLDPT